MARQQLSDLDFINGTRIINLPDGTDPQHPATVAQLRAQIEGIAWKDSVQLATTANIDINSPGVSFDGSTPDLNARVLLRFQSIGNQNGIYIYNGASTPLTRAPDANTFAELEGAVVTVEEGSTLRGTTWRQELVNGTLGIDSVSWVPFGTAVSPASETVSGIAEIATQAEVDAGTDNTRIVTPAKLKNAASNIKRHEADFGDGTATAYVITHNFNTRDVQVAVYRNSGNYDRVELDIEHTSVNSITVRTAAPVASNALRAVIKR